MCIGNGREVCSLQATQLQKISFVYVVFLFLFSVSFNGLDGIKCWILAGGSNQESMSVHYCCQDREVLVKIFFLRAGLTRHVD